MKTVPEEFGDVIGDDPAGVFSLAARENLASWRDPEALEGDRTYEFRTFPAVTAALFNLAEAAVHGWDVAKATGQESELAPDVVAMLFQFCQMVPLEDLRASGALGPEVAVPEPASPTDRLMGLLGRQP